ncbi:MAG: ribosome hibernation-promoting factor, HPF/YfiA family [Eubacteriales bacterium]
MKTTVNGRSVTITEDQKLLFDKKMARFDRIFGDDAESIAVLRKAGRNITVEVTISSGGMLYRSEVEDEAWQTALDRCIEHIERQIRKNKTRLAKRLRDNTFRDPGYPAQTPAPAEEEEEEGAFVVHTKSFPIKPMSVEEAILQMNLLGHAFFVYRDAETEEMNVVYKRNDGDYGRITDADK